MSANRDTNYDESTDEEDKNLPVPSALDPGKINILIFSFEYFTWAYHSNYNNP